MADFEALRKKIEALPPERQSQIADFVDYLIHKAQRLAATAPAPEAASTSPPDKEWNQGRSE